MTSKKDKKAKMPRTTSSKDSGVIVSILNSVKKDIKALETSNTFQKQIKTEIEHLKEMHNTTLTLLQGQSQIMKQLSLFIIGSPEVPGQLPAATGFAHAGYENTVQLFNRIEVMFEIMDSVYKGQMGVDPENNEPMTAKDLLKKQMAMRKSEHDAYVEEERLKAVAKLEEVPDDPFSDEKMKELNEMVNEIKKDASGFVPIEEGHATITDKGKHITECILRFAEGGITQDEVNEAIGYIKEMSDSEEEAKEFIRWIQEHDAAELLKLVGGKEADIARAIKNLAKPGQELETVELEPEPEPEQLIDVDQSEKPDPY